MSEKRNLSSLNDDIDDVGLQIDNMTQEYLQSLTKSMSQDELESQENEQSKTQSPDENNNDTHPRSKRSRKPTDRFGLTEDEEENDDLLFDQIDAKTNSNKATDIHVTTEKSDIQKNDSIDPAIVSQLTPGEQILFKKLVDLSTDVKVLQKTVVELELRQGKVEVETHNLNSADGALLLEIGLPLANEENINDFNDKLKKKSFWLIVVGIFN